MRKKQSAPIPRSLDRLRREIEQWRQRQTTRKRLPREFWAKAAEWAQQYGGHRTARTLGLKYASLRQHLAAKTGDAAQRPPIPYRFVELPPGALTAGSLTCTIELDGGRGATLRMHVQGATMADLAAFAARWRSDQP
jgi:hypothetical protein